MRANINFLRERLFLSKRKARKLFLIRTWSSLIMVIYILLIISTFSFYLLTKKTNQVIKRKIKQEEKKIEDLRSIEAKQVYLHQKTQSLSKIIASKKQHQEIVESLLNLLPQGISVDNFHISKNGLVSFSGRCLSFKVLRSFFDTLQIEENALHLKIKQAQIKTLAYGYDKEYVFDAEILFYLGEN